MTDAKFHFNRFMVTLIFGIRAYEARSTIDLIGLVNGPLVYDQNFLGGKGWWMGRGVAVKGA